MKLHDYQRSRSFFDFGRRSLTFQKFVLVFSKSVWSFKTKFYVKLYGSIEMKIYINGLRHMSKMAATPIYGKTLKKLILQNQKADCNETCDLALWAHVYHSLFKLWLSMTYFTPRSKLVDEAFV